MIKAEKKTLKLSAEKPQYITVYNLPGNKRWKNLSLHPLDLWRRMADDG